MNPKARVDVKEEVNMVRHDLQLKQTDVEFKTNLGDDLFEADIDPLNENSTPVLWAPNHMIDTAKSKMPILPICSV